MDKVRLGIIGVGGMGSGHAGYIIRGEVNNCELVAVCDIEKRKMDRYADYKCFADSRELIRSGEVDAVLIATPHYDHTTIGIDALENGLHVLVEKPISVHKADCQKLIAARKDKNLVFEAMFNMRTEPLYIKLKKLIENGEVGEITRINWIVTDWFRTEAYYASGGWRATWSGEGGGVLLNQCPHNLDMMQWIFGMPSKIKAFCGWGAKHNIEVEDQVTAYLEYPNGATGVFVTTTGESPGTNRLEVAGERGKIVIENGKIQFTRNEVEMTEFSRTTDKAFVTVPVWHIEVPVGGQRGGHRVITQNFVDAITSGAELIAPAEEGIKSIEIANSMLYSAWTGETVNLPLDAAAYEAALKEKCATSKYKKQVVEIQGEDISASFK